MNVKRLTAFALAAALPLSLLPSLAAETDFTEKKRVTKTVSFQGDKDLKLGIKYGDVEIESVRIRNWPDAEDFEKAAKDLNDTHTMVVEFTYSNRDDARDYKCKYVVTIPSDKKGDPPYGTNDRTATLDKGKIEDTNKMFVKMKTRHYKTVKTFDISFEIWRK